MSPILARAAIRAVTRNATVRNTSTLRSFARSFEPHPFERLPVTQAPAPGAYGKLFKNAASRFVFFVPAISILLGWPLIGEKILEGHL